ncbi:MAG: fasciclin domain-containing protein [Bacteroidaceae bacterium]|jgi:uncharacterized surface protein with fasciclin (FAS1) repeats|nr:fasciclin domain-containing protein [Bacteroidaceae bacterium]MBR6820429.1 fasciclin domain-containing protein [Bacteroidaceae bacterium]MBR7051533.1 fasciclin domain-containing protein [Bacteroidaceae bacterium]
MKILKYIWALAIPATMLFSTAALNSCSDDIPEDALGIKKGIMMAEFLSKNPQFSEFYTIIKKARTADLSTSARFDEVLSCWGRYTCFAPTNVAVHNYLAKKGLSSVDQLSPEACDTIVRFHLLADNVYYTSDIYNMTGNQLKTPNLLKSYLTYNIVQVKEGGSVVASTLRLNAIANVNYLNCNDTVENGVVHEIDALLEAPNTSAERLVNDKSFKLFYQAFDACGLLDTLKVDKDRTWDEKYDSYQPTSIYSGAQWDYCLVPDTKLYGFTVFMVSDGDLASKGLNTVSALYNHACTLYGRGGYPERYEDNTPDQLKEHDNPLYQMMAYHILPFKANYNKLTTITTIETGLMNPTEWYRTVNANALLKVEHITLERDITDLGLGITTSDAVKKKYLYLNHFSDTIETHPSIKGVKVYRPDDPEDLIENNEGTNCFLFRVADLVDFSEATQESNVFNARMRMDMYTMFPVLLTNQIRSDVTNEGMAMSNSKDAACKNYWFPAGYIDGLEVNSDAIFLYQGPHNTYWSYEGDEFNITSKAGNYDVTMEIPPVPSGNYQIRLGFADMPTRGICQFYFDGKPVGLPFDMRSDNFNERTQWTDIWTGKSPYVTPTTEEALAAKKAMHNLGWYHGPASVFSISGEGHEDGDPTVTKNYFSRNARTVRYVLGGEPVNIENNGKPHTIRIKSVLAATGTVVMLDYLEFVPKSVWGVEDAEGGEDDL